jgi:hypothetical protein
MTKFKGHFTAYLKDSPEEIIWAKKNVEVVIGGWLLAWAMASQSLSVNASGSTPILPANYPIWGLAIGGGDSVLLPQTDTERKLMTRLVQEKFRKKSSYIYFLDPAAYVNGQKIPVANITPYLEIQTVFNSNTDIILQTQATQGSSTTVGWQITEMGLVGGSSQQLVGVDQSSINMGGGPVNQTGGGILLDYVNPDAFVIPLSRDFIIAVVLDFSH